MNKLLIHRLFESFNELERAIGSARRTLEQKKQPQRELLERITSYEQILIKQRDLATALCGHSALGNWDEVARHVRIINGLSAMIRDDAREILARSQEDTEALESSVRPLLPC